MLSAAVSLSPSQPFRPLSPAEAANTELAQALLDRRDDASEAWGKLLPLVKRIARKNLSPGADLEDAVQNVLLHLLVGVHRLRDPRALPGFVVTVASRTLRRERGRRRVELRELSDFDGQELAVAAPDDPAAHHAWLRLQELLARLKVRDRRTFLLHVLQGMSLSEIADLLGVSLPTARRSYARARDRIDSWARLDPFLSDYGCETVPSKRRAV